MNTEDKNEIQIRSDEIQEILTRVPNWIIRTGSIVILSLLFLLLFLSWIVKYPDTILAEAIVTTEIPPHKEYAKVTGKIDTIFVDNNQIVSNNTHLAFIENTASYQDVVFLESILDTLNINQENTYFPVEKMPILLLGEIEDEYSLFIEAYTNYKLNIEYNLFDNEDLSNQLTNSELQKRLIIVENLKQLNKTKLKLKEKETERYLSLYNKGVISRQELDNKEFELAETSKDYKDFDVLSSQIKESAFISKKGTNENQLKKIREHTKLKRGLYQTYTGLKKAIRDWEIKYVLKSEIEGKVNFLNTWYKNQNVKQGELVFSVVPNENVPLIAKLKAPAYNFGKIKKGFYVLISLYNYPESEFGNVRGKVINISSIPDESGNYTIDVELQNPLVTSYNKLIPFNQEMRGSAEIITKDLRLIQRFIYIFKDLKEN